MDPDEVAGAVYDLVDKRIDAKQHAIVEGTWVSAETIDTNLSVVTIEGNNIRYIRKLSHVTGLTTGDTLMLLRSPGTPLTIIGKIVGDITLAGAFQ